MSGEGGRGAGAGGRGTVIEATVLEELPRAIYKVALENGQPVLAHAVGTVERNFVRLLPGDRVQVEISPHDATRGRITRRLIGNQR